MLSTNVSRFQYLKILRLIIINIFILCNVIFVRLGTIKQIYKNVIYSSPVKTTTSSSGTFLLIHNVTTNMFVAG